MNEVVLYEELSMNAHPAVQTNLYDGWILRFANGHTNRANSVNMLYPSSIDIASKIKFCEKAYTSCGLATVFKITPLSSNDLDMLLEKRGYEKITPTNLMIKHIETNDMSGSNVIISDTVTKTWQDDYFRLNGITDEARVATNRIIQANIRNKVLCASIVEDGITIASGFCVIEREYAGLFEIIVDSNHRRKGLGFDICASLLNRAFDEGARFAYLQVVEDNTQAIELYHKLGFSKCYQYWYRVKGDFVTV